MSSKHGFMFTFVTIFLIGIFVLMLSVATSNIMQAQQQATAERTESIVMNMFTKKLTQEYFTPFVKIAGATGLRAMVGYINVTHTMIDDPVAFYADIILNGTVPTYYSTASLSNDFAMTVVVKNGTNDITIASIATGTDTEYFGNETVLAQRISAPANYGNVENIKSISVTIEDNGASSTDLYFVLYNSTQNVVGIDHQQYESGKILYTFSFGGHFPLKTDDYYDLALAAPFTDTNNAYSVNVAPAAAFTCSLLSSFDCDLATWTVLDPSETTGDMQNIPIDFYLNNAVMGEGFLRALINSFEGLGKEELNIDTWINMTNITIQEDNAWIIEVNASFLVSTSKTTVSFSNIQSYGEAEISIIGIEDPYSILRTDILSETGRYYQIIKQNVSDDFSEDDFARHIAYHTFVFNENAPSFLERFKGADAESSSCCGIQAIYLSDDISVVSEDSGYSFIDYMFQESAQCSSDDPTVNPLYYPDSSGALYGLSSASTPPWFDYASIEFYGVDNMSGVHVNSINCPTESAGP